MSINIIYILSLIILLFTVYCLLPTYYYKLTAGRAVPGLRTDSNIILSFDDGPDPLYTLRLLEILRLNEIRAVFFVVAEKAARYPDIIGKIKAEGHIIGLHSLEHGNAFFKSPSYQKKDFKQSLEIFEGLGLKPRLYRPPWGHLNISSLILAKKHGLNILLWTVMVQDWEKASTPQRLEQRLLKRTKSGSIICLHDSGCGKAAFSGAPERLLDALAVCLPLLRKKGCSFILP
jgi:peptidoglycan/xylan/chitin deacetylase (PgdA/CDA1 family)